MIMHIEQLKDQLRRDGEVTFSIRVRPKASKSKIIGMMDDGVMKIEIKALPEDGKANLELIRFIAEHFEVSRQSVSIIGGIATRRKIVRIALNQ